MKLACAYESKECRHLSSTDQRLFAKAFTLAQAGQLGTGLDLAEWVGSLCRQVLLSARHAGAKLLPLPLAAPGEQPSAAIDNLERAERLGLMNGWPYADSEIKWRTNMSKTWPYSPSALQNDRAVIPALIAAAQKMSAEIEQRGWV